MLLIDGKKLIPAPFVTLNKSYGLSGDGTTLACTFNINLEGTILPAKGSPSSTGVWHTAAGYPADEALTGSDAKFNSILAKQQYIRNAFSTPGSVLEYAPSDGSPAIIANVRTAQINFEAGTWTDLCRYTISVEAVESKRQDSTDEDNFGDFDQLNLADATENIQITQADDGTQIYTITHTVSAVGRKYYDGIGTQKNNRAPWENAKVWVVAHIDSGISSYLVDTTSKTKYNKRRVETIDKYSGSYSITTTYTVNQTDANFTNTYEINISTVREQAGNLEDGTQGLSTSYTISGNIVGQDADNLPATKLANAEAAYTAFEATIPTLLGLNADHLFQSKTIGKNPFNGTISYSLTYGNSNNGTIAHTYQITDNLSAGQLISCTIQGNLQGFLIDGEISAAWTNVQTAWNNRVKPDLASIVSDITTANIVATPHEFSVGFNKAQAQINYSATFYYVTDYFTQTAVCVDQFEVSLNEANTNSTITTVRSSASASINGNLLGLGEDLSERYNNALTKWNSIKTGLHTRIAEVLGITVGDRILSRTVSYNRFNGTINYSYNYTLRDDLDNPDIISAQITIQYNKPKQVFAVQIIPGLTSGPIIQDINTYTEESRTLSVNLLLSKSATMSTGDAYVTTLLSTYRPTGRYFLSDNQISYSPDTGEYSQTLTWTYKGT